METGTYRAARAAGCLKAAFASALAMNLAEALRDPEGVVRVAARVTVGALFTTALAAYLVLWVLRRRRARSDRL
ncbi:hypothetical protein [Streptomyces sp. NPDC029041]|uniref:hypothetical protein n=1 Tax=Streptomyces sp. NPDC029041 TaxID=3155727 RepID=UPI0033C7089E